MTTNEKLQMISYLRRMVRTNPNTNSVDMVKARKFLDDLQEEVEKDEAWRQKMESQKTMSPIEEFFYN